MRPSQVLALHRAELRQLAARHGMLHLRVFGSVLTGDDTDNSDLDLLVEPGSTSSLLTVAKLTDEAERQPDQIGEVEA